MLERGESAEATRKKKISTNENGSKYASKIDKLEVPKQRKWGKKR